MNTNLDQAPPEPLPPPTPKTKPKKHKPDTVRFHIELPPDVAARLNAFAKTHKLHRSPAIAKLLELAASKTPAPHPAPSPHSPSLPAPSPPAPAYLQPRGIIGQPIVHKLEPSALASAIPSALSF